MTLNEFQKNLVRHIIETGDTRHIIDAFAWSHSDEGFAYWNQVYNSGVLTQEAMSKLLTMLGEGTPEERSTEPSEEYKFARVNITDGELVFSYSGVAGFGTIVGGPEITEYKEFGNRLGSKYSFPLTDFYRSRHEFYNHISILDFVGLVVVKVEEDSTTIAGCLDPVQKAFGFKTLENFYTFYLLGIANNHISVTNSDFWLFKSRELVHNLYCKRYGSELDLDVAHLAVYYYRPEFSDEGASIFMNYRDLERGRRTTISIGKFLRKIFPGVKDADLERMIDTYNKQFIKRNFTLMRSKEAKDFRKAYNGRRVEMLNPATTSERKSIANSCMRDMAFNGMSPAEMYASGDFEILWLESPEGRVGGRCVVHVPQSGKPQAGPVYGSCEHSMDLLEEELCNMGAVMYPDSSWEGARLEKIYVDYGFLICYSDLEENARDKGDYLVVDDCGDVSLTTTDGTSENQDDDSYFCEGCEDRVHEEDAMISQCGTPYCESCYSERYVHCQITGCEVDVDDAVEVLTSNPMYVYGASVSSPKLIWIDPDNVSYGECYYTGENWLLDDMEEDAEGDNVSPRYARDNMKEIDCVFYTNEQLIEHGLDEKEEEEAA